MGEWRDPLLQRVMRALRAGESSRSVDLTPASPTTDVSTPEPMPVAPSGVPGQPALRYTKVPSLVAVPAGLILEPVQRDAAVSRTVARLGRGRFGWVFDSAVHATPDGGLLLDGRRTAFDNDIGTPVRVDVLADGSVAITVPATFRVTTRANMSPPQPYRLITRVSRRLDDGTIEVLASDAWAARASTDDCVTLRVPQLL